MDIFEVGRQLYRIIYKLLLIGLVFLLMLALWYKLPVRRHSKYFIISKVHLFRSGVAYTMAKSSADSIVKLRIQFEYSIDRKRNEWTSEFRDYMEKCSSFESAVWKDTSGIASFNKMLIYSGQATSTSDILLGSQALLLFHRFDNEELNKSSINIGNYLGIGIDYYEDYPSVYCSMSEASFQRFIHILKNEGIEVILQQ